MNSNQTTSPMAHHRRAARTSLSILLPALALAPALTGAQGFWSEDTPKIPMAASWQVEKAGLPPYEAPRTPHGTPDLQGVWGGAGGDGLSYVEEHDYVDVTTPAQESFISDPPDGKVPYTEWGQAKRDELLAGLARGWPGETGERLYSAPSAYCLENMPAHSIEGVEIVQQPGVVYMFNDIGFRVIPIDDRPAMKDDVKLWFGISRGRWEGDTLVVEVTNLNGLGWFDSTGLYFTENTVMTERWTRVHEDTIDYELTITDPTVYTQPWKMNFPMRRPGTGPNMREGRLPTAVAIDAPAYEDPYADEIWELACFEGNIGGPAALRELGYQWFRGVHPPQ
ncbi:MAG TPA: hypothetical protein VIV14_03185 [Gammaproteobacteria bacterium]